MASPVTELTDEQAACIDAILRKRSVFVTGQAGTGKSRLVGMLKELYPSCPVLAPSGLAALNVGGETIHRFMGGGLLNTKRMSDLVNDVRRRRAWIADLEILIIDEIGMVHPMLLWKLSLFLTLIRHRMGVPSAHEPFGGVQMIFFGDFMQLSPVSKPYEVMHDQNYRCWLQFNKMDNLDSLAYCFQDRTWKDLDPEVHVLTRQFRQGGDLAFAQMLGRLRVNQLTAADHHLLRSRVARPGDVENVLHLFPTNGQADDKNAQHLVAQDKSTQRTFTGRWKFKKLVHKHVPVPTGKLLASTLAACRKSSHVKEVIHLRTGCFVMHLINSDPLVNGSRGEVIGWEQTADGETCPLVKWDTGADSVVLPVTIDRAFGNAILSIRQVPLTLSAAITIHKAQGMSLQEAAISTRSFATSQTYVAISRLRSLSGLHLLDYHPAKIAIDTRTAEFDAKLRATGSRKRRHSEIQ